MDNMNKEQNYIDINRKSWNSRTEVHLESEFYDLENFIKGKSSLNNIELALLGDVSGKSILHLQCHFGQDSISLNRLGAKVTGVDFSDKAIESADKLIDSIVATTYTKFLFLLLLQTECHPHTNMAKAALNTLAR